MMPKEETVRRSLESSQSTRLAHVAGLVFLVLVAAVVLFPRATGATSSPSQGASKYFIYLPPNDYYYKFAELNNTYQSGDETFCVVGPDKHVGETLTVHIHAKTTHKLVLTAALPLRSDLTTSVLGQGDGHTFEAYARLDKDCVACSITWPEKHDLWEIMVRRHD
jgi:hypothetical protein